MNLLWRVYYSDGTTIDNTESNPNDAKSKGIICVVIPDATVGRIVLSRWDFYFYHPKDNDWWGVDFFGVLDQMELLGYIMFQNTGSFDRCKVLRPDKTWVEMDKRGAILALSHDGIIKIGRMLSNAEYKDVYENARNDLDFPIKSAKSKTETP